MSAAWWAVLMAAAGTFAMRASFLVVAHRMATVPPNVLRLLRQIPPAALAALIVPALVRPGGQLELASPELAAGLLAGVVAWRTRNVGLTLVVGLGALMVLQASPLG